MGILDGTPHLGLLADMNYYDQFARDDAGRPMPSAVRAQEQAARAQAQSRNRAAQALLDEDYGTYFDETPWNVALFDDQRGLSFLQGGVERALDAYDAWEPSWSDIPAVGRAVVEGYAGQISDAMADPTNPAKMFPLALDTAGLGSAASMATKSVPRGSLAMNVYQGSPHKYGPEGASQSLKHIGKGEGAQAYGWGRYDAENRAVAQDYYNTFADPDQQPLSFMDRPVDEIWNDGIKERWADVVKDMTEDEVDAFTEVMGNLSQVNTMQDVPSVVQNLSPDAKRVYRKYVEKDLIKPPTEAHLYTHDLPDEDIARYLDWDAPLSEQPESVRKFADRLSQDELASMLRKYERGDVPSDYKVKVSDKELKELDELYEQLGDFKDLPQSEIDAGIAKANAAQAERARIAVDAMFGPNKKGQGFYKELVNIYGSDKAASEALARAGIPGLKYYDGMSRTTPLNKDIFVDGRKATYAEESVIRNLSNFGGWGGVEELLKSGGAEKIGLTKKAGDDILENINALKAAEREFREPVRTRNFVTWDQDVLNRMKLLQRNDEVFGLLDEGKPASGILSDGVDGQ